VFQTFHRLEVEGRVGVRGRIFRNMRIFALVVHMHFFYVPSEGRSYRAVDGTKGVGTLQPTHSPSTKVTRSQWCCTYPPSTGTGSCNDPRRSETQTPVQQLSLAMDCVNVTMYILATNELCMDKANEMNIKGEVHIRITTYQFG